MEILFIKNNFRTMMTLIRMDLENNLSVLMSQMQHLTVQLWFHVPFVEGNSKEREESKFTNENVLKNKYYDNMILIQ